MTGISRHKSGVRNEYVLVICRERKKRDREKESTYRNKRGLQKVAHRRRRSFRLRVAILHTSQLQQSLGGRRSDDASASRSRDQSAHDRSNLAADLGWHRVWFTKGSAPVTSPHRDHSQFGQDDSAADGGSDFLGAFNTQSDMSVEITDSDKGFEPCALAGAGLLLNRHDFHDFVLEFWQEKVDDLEFFHREGEQVNLLHRLDFPVLD